MPPLTLADKIGEKVIADLKLGPKLQPTIGKTLDGHMIGHIFINEFGATIRVQAFQKENRKHPKFIVTVQPKDGKKIELSPKYSRMAWVIANGEKRTSGPRKIVPDDEAINSALNALGMED